MSKFLLFYNADLFNYICLAQENSNNLCQLDVNRFRFKVFSSQESWSYFTSIFRVKRYICFDFKFAQKALTVRSSTVNSLST